MLTRRSFLASAGATLAVPAGFAMAQERWQPTREVEFVIPFGVGGGSDLLARMIHKIIIEEKLVPQPMVLNNRPGGGGAAGVGYVRARKASDPHTLLILNGSTQITPILNPQAQTLSEVRPVARVMLDDMLLCVRSDASWKDARDFVANAKTRPPKSLAFGTGGTTDNMAIALLARANGLEFSVVNFSSGGESVTQLLGGHVQACMGNPSEFMPHIRSGALRALGIFRADRFAALPDVPTMKEAGFNMPTFQMWRGIALPKGAPDSAARYWEEVFMKVVATPAYKAYVADNFGSEGPMRGAEFASYLQEQEALFRELLGKQA